MILWHCPNRCPAVRGPERPRKDATCRFCLTCSAKSKHLVPREAPSLMKKKERREYRRRMASRKTRARKRLCEEARFMIRGVDFRVELKKIWKLPAVKERLTRLCYGNIPPKLAIQCYSAARNRMGTAYRNEWKIVINTWPEAEHEIDTLLHEVAHLLVRPGLRPHGPEFKAILRTLTEEYKMLHHVERDAQPTEDAM